MKDLSAILVGPSDSIRGAMECIDRNAKGIALMVDAEGRLMGTVTDGDIRRAILAGTPLDAPATSLLAKRAPRYFVPLTAPVGTPTAELLKLMNDHHVRHVPLVDGARRVVDIAFLSDIVKEYEPRLKAVVMAGGFGTRLRPLTNDTPKPMLPLGDRPLLELIIGRLRDAGIRRVNLTTHYRSDVISNHFGDGKKFGVEIRYVNEDQPLGTAGAISMLEASDEPLLVLNGDILTGVDFGAMLEFHREQDADMTVAVRPHEVRVAFGVVDMDGVTIRRIVEKPVLKQFVNAGIYLLNPEVVAYIPSGKRVDMPELIEMLIKDQRRVVGFPVREYWLDIGQMKDYEQAVAHVAMTRVTTKVATGQ